MWQILCSCCFYLKSTSTCTIVHFSSVFLDWNISLQTHTWHIVSVTDALAEKPISDLPGKDARALRLCFAKSYFPFCILQKEVVYCATSPFFRPPCILRSFWPQLAWKSSVLSHRSHGAWCCRSRSTCNKQLQCRKAMEASGGHIGTRQILPCVKKKISSELGIKSISSNLKWESKWNWV